VVYFSSEKHGLAVKPANDEGSCPRRGTAPHHPELPGQ
jgi:hypothetical protein